MLAPATQYVGTVQRTHLQLSEPAPLPGLAALDLTPVYVVLLAATILLAALRAMEARRGAAAVAADEETAL